MQARHVIGIALLIAAVPLQVYLMRHNRGFRDLVSEIGASLPESVRGLSVDLSGYAKAANEYLQNIYEYFGWSKPPVDENPPSSLNDDQEVPEELIRDFRPPHLDFRIGDVVLTKNIVVGVIVGWNIDKNDLSKDPEYFLLVEDNESFIKDKQNYLILIENIQIKHSQIDYYFESFDGIRYIPRKWMQKMYPKD